MKQITYVLLTAEGRHEALVRQGHAATINGVDIVAESVDHVTSLMAGYLDRSGERFREWWIEDDNGAVIESHDELVAWTARRKRHRIAAGQLASESERMGKNR